LNRKKRLDDTYKVLLTIYTLVLSIVIAFFGRTSTECAVFLFLVYASTICSWSTAHLLGGKDEYLIKFVSWFMLLGGITQSILMLYLWTLDLQGYYFAANWVIALFIYYLVFRYIRPLLEEDVRNFLKMALLVFTAFCVVICSLKLLSVI